MQCHVNKKSRLRGHITSQKPLSPGVYVLVLECKASQQYDQNQGKAAKHIGAADLTAQCPHQSEQSSAHLVDQEQVQQEQPEPAAVHTAAMSDLALLTTGRRFICCCGILPGLLHSHGCLGTTPPSHNTLPLHHCTNIAT